MSKGQNGGTVGIWDDQLLTRNKRSKAARSVVYDHICTGEHSKQPAGWCARKGVAGKAYKRENKALL